MPLVQALKFTALCFDEAAIHGAVAGESTLTESVCKEKMRAFVRNIVLKSQVMLTSTQPLLFNDDGAAKQFFLVQSGFAAMPLANMQRRMFGMVVKQRVIFAKIMQQWPRVLRVRTFAVQEDAAPAGGAGAGGGGAGVDDAMATLRAAMADLEALLAFPVDATDVANAADEELGQLIK